MAQYNVSFRLNVLNEVEHLKKMKNRWKVNIIRINHSRIYSASRLLLHLLNYTLHGSRSAAYSQCAT